MPRSTATTTTVLWRRWRRHNTSYFAATLGGLAAALRATPSHRAPLPGQRPTTMDCSRHALNALRAFDRARG